MNTLPELLSKLSFALLALQVQAAELPQIDPIIAIQPYLEQLAKCENRDRVNRILDTNGYYSYGKYMYQLDTFRRDGVKQGYWTNEITNAELRVHIQKDWLQDDMTARTLVNEPEGYRRWFNCTIGDSPNKIGKPPI